MQRQYFSSASGYRGLCLMACLFCSHAFAQWQWLDKSGHRVFSDRSPPADIPEKNILKRPAGSQALNLPEQASASPSVASSAALPAKGQNVPKVSGKDASLEAKKKRAEEEEAAKKKAEEQRVAKAKAENCERAKRGLQTFDSGIRLSTTNAKGEREIMDDATRAVESKRLQGVIASECS